MLLLELFHGLIVLAISGKPRRSGLAFYSQSNVLVATSLKEDKPEKWFQMCLDVVLQKRKEQESSSYSTYDTRQFSSTSRSLHTIRRCRLKHSIPDRYSTISISVHLHTPESYLVMLNSRVRDGDVTTCEEVSAQIMQAVCIEHLFSKLLPDSAGLVRLLSVRTGLDECSWKWNVSLALRTTLFQYHFTVTKRAIIDRIGKIERWRS